MEIVKIALTIVGSAVGAGFASGQELIIFFVRFLSKGIFGAVISGTLITLFSVLILAESYDLKNNSYQNFLKRIFPEAFSKFFYVISQIFLSVSFIIMVSGSSELLQSFLSIPKIIGEFITLLICFICFCKSKTGLYSINVLLTPLMIIGFILVSIIYLFSDKSVFYVPHNLESNYLFFAILYMSYNILSLSAVLSNISPTVKSKKEAVLGGVFGGAILTVIMVLCQVALLKGFDNISDYNFPMLALAKEIGEQTDKIYFVLIFMAMITTAVSSGFCVNEMIKSFGISKSKSALILCISTMFLSKIKFAVLVKNAYILFGVLGLGLIVGIILKNIKNKG